MFYSEEQARDSPWSQSKSHRGNESEGRYRSTDLLCIWRVTSAIWSFISTNLHKTVLWQKEAEKPPESAWRSELHSASRCSKWLHAKAARTALDDVDFLSHLPYLSCPRETSARRSTASKRSLRTDVPTLYQDIYIVIDPLLNSELDVGFSKWTFSSN